MSRVLIWLFLFVSPIGISSLSADPRDELVILSPHWEGIKYEYDHAFEKYLGSEIDIRWIDVGGTSDILRYLETASTDPSAPHADLLFGGGTFPFVILAKKGLLEKAEIPREIRDSIPAQLDNLTLVDPQGQWFSAMLSTFGILCNTEVLDRLDLSAPITWEELADPRYRSWIAAADPRKSGSAHVVFEIILQAYGWQRGWKIVQGIGRNTRSFAAGSSELPHSVLVGEVACTMLIDSYAAHIMSTDNANVLSFHVPAGLSPFSGDAIAVLKGSPNRTLAEKFVEFALSRSGQDLLALPVGDPSGPQRFQLRRLSVLPELYTEERTARGFMLNPFKARKRLAFRESKASARWGLLNDLLGVFVIESETIAQDSPPISAEEAEKLTAVWNQPEERLTAMARWRSTTTGNEVVISFLELAGLLFYLLLIVAGLSATAPLRTRARGDRDKHD